MDAIISKIAKKKIMHDKYSGPTVLRERGDSDCREQKDSGQMFF